MEKLYTKKCVIIWYLIKVLEVTKFLKLLYVIK